MEISSSSSPPQRTVPKSLASNDDSYNPYHFHHYTNCPLDNSHFHHRVNDQKHNYLVPSQFYCKCVDRKCYKMLLFQLLSGLICVLWCVLDLKKNARLCGNLKGVDRFLGGLLLNRGCRSRRACCGFGAETIHKQIIIRRLGTVFLV